MQLFARFSIRPGDVPFGPRDHHQPAARQLSYRRLRKLNVTPDPAGTVIVLDVGEEPKEHWIPMRVKANQPTVLSIDSARVYGSTLRIENRDGVDNLGYWTTPL